MLPLYSQTIYIGRCFTKNVGSYVSDKNKKFDHGAVIKGVVLKMALILVKCED